MAEMIGTGPILAVDIGSSGAAALLDDAGDPCAQGVVVFVPVPGAGRMPADSSVCFVVPPAVPVPAPIAGALPGSAGPVPPVPAPPRPAPGVPAPFIPVALVPAAGLAVWAIATLPIRRQAAAAVTRRNVFDMVFLPPRRASLRVQLEAAACPAKINRRDGSGFRRLLALVDLLQREVGAVAVRQVVQ